MPGASIPRKDSIAQQNAKLSARLQELADEKNCTTTQILLEAMFEAFNAHIAAGKPVQDLGTDLIG